jgi:2-iminobutanoate/2-iminopropanoate deaminase
MSQQIEVISSSGAPPAIGPYSQAIRAGDFVFVSGQLAVDVRSGKLAEGIAAQTSQVLENLRAVLAAAGASLDQVVKVTIFLGRWEDFPAMNEVYARYFGARPPARSVVQGPRIPEGTLVGLEAVAFVGK